VGGNATIGAKTSTSTAKSLSVYGRNNSTNPALNIYGVYGNNSAYVSSLYTASDGLHITTTLNVAGNITATGNIVAGTASDRRLKDHIKTMAAQTAVDVLKALRPVEYEWNEKAGELGGLTGVSRGFVADEYKDIIPNATRKIWGAYDAIDYQQAIPYLVAGWQALYAEVQELKRRLGDGI
ncbi:MAG: tail fiber domain-containing protein, partial [Bacteroidales bacterium]|nr:tail fiber domain-containing protein [Bacteroidales bacterium]